MLFTLYKLIGMEQKQKNKTFIHLIKRRQGGLDSFDEYLSFHKFNIPAVGKPTSMANPRVFIKLPIPLLTIAEETFNIVTKT